MPYRLDLSTDAPTAVRDAAREQLADAVRRLRDDREDEPVKAVHEARKDLKKTRSLLRLARPGMDRDAFRRENRTLRDAGRALSGARDADVLVEVAEDLAARYDGQLPQSSFAALRDTLAAEARAARADDRRRRRGPSDRRSRGRRRADGRLAARRLRPRRARRRRGARLPPRARRAGRRRATTPPSSGCTTCASASRTSGTTPACSRRRGRGC